jgi:long-chain fatty acid transport protein
MILNKHIKGAIILSVIASGTLYATNGDTLIGVGAKTRAMGGAGIALSQGAESTLVNPALITKVKNTEISFGGTIFAPNIKTTFQGVESKSSSDLSMIPAVAIASKVMPNLYAGIGMYGTAGMGVDFRGNPAHMDMETTLQLMQFAAPIAYKSGGLSVGISPIIQYGSLDINYKNYMVPNQPQVGYGQTQDFGFGVSLGAVYDFDNGFSIGAVYKSKITMKYPKVLTTAANPLGVMVGDTLTQPAEYGVGIGYVNGPHSIALDVKKIAWSKAKGYKEFNWSDQTVIALGYQYSAKNWALRFGYNYAKSPIKASQNPMINTFNLLGFPATAKSHFTAGGSYKFSKNFSADLALVYAPESKSSLNSQTPYAISNKHSEFGTTIQFNYRF